ncbi:unnamed protein product, partial [Callosobruchus maculatus]
IFEALLEDTFSLLSEAPQLSSSKLIFFGTVSRVTSHRSFETSFSLELVVKELLPESADCSLLDDNLDDPALELLELLDIDFAVESLGFAFPSLRGFVPHDSSTMSFPEESEAPTSRLELLVLSVDDLSRGVLKVDPSLTTSFGAFAGESVLNFASELSMEGTLLKVELLLSLLFGIISVLSMLCVLLEELCATTSESTCKVVAASRKIPGYWDDPRCSEACLDFCEEDMRTPNTNDDVDGHFLGADEITTWQGEQLSNLMRWIKFNEGIRSGASPAYHDKRDETSKDEYACSGSNYAESATFRNLVF